MKALSKMVRTITGYAASQVLYLAVVLGEPGIELAPSREAWFRIEWERQLAEDDCEYSPVRMALNPKDKSILIGAETSGTCERSQGGQLALWKLHKDGRLIGKTAIERPQSNQAHPLVRIHALACTTKGDAVLAVEQATTTALYLLRITNDGQYVFAKEINWDKQPEQIHRILPTHDEDLILVASSSEYWIVAKADAGGNVLWKTELRPKAAKSDTDGVAYLQDAIRGDDGEIVVVGACVAAPHATRIGPVGPASVYVASLDANGKLKTETYFPGRLASIGKGEDGSYVLVYDDMDLSKSADGRYRIFVAALDRNLKVLWKHHIASSNTNPVLPFHIAFIPRGRFVVTGDVEMKFVVAAGDQRGDKPLVDARVHSQGPLICRGMIADGNSVLVLALVGSWDEQWDGRFRVKLIRLNF